MIAKDHQPAGGAIASSGRYVIGCLLTVLLSACTSPTSMAGTAAKSQVPTAAPPAARATAPSTQAATELLPGDAERGQELYESRCFACHSLDANRVGPSHERLFGRTAGKFRDYDYSAAVKASKIVWNETTLNAWLTDPQALIPGQKMNYAVTDPKDRADIIAYLKAATSAK